MCTYASLCGCAHLSTGCTETGRGFAPTPAGAASLCEVAGGFFGKELETSPRVILNLNCCSSSPAPRPVLLDLAFHTLQKMLFYLCSD